MTLYELEVLRKKEQELKRREKRVKIMFWSGFAMFTIGLSLFGVAAYAQRNVEPETIVEESYVSTPVYEPVFESTPVIESPKTDISQLYSDEIVYIAKTVYGEARGCTPTEQAAVVWSILNRVDSDLRYLPDDIISVVTQNEQYLGYNPKHPVTDEIADLVEDVLGRWEREKNGENNVGRVLPKNYLWFYGDGKHNHFTDAWRGGNKWNWSLESPYETH